MYYTETNPIVFISISGSLIIFFILYFRKLNKITPASLHTPEEIKQGWYFDNNGKIRSIEFNVIASLIYADASHNYHCTLVNSHTGNVLRDYTEEQASVVNRYLAQKYNAEITYKELYQKDYTMMWYPYSLKRKKFYTIDMRTETRNGITKKCGYLTYWSYKNGDIVPDSKTVGYFDANELPIDKTIGPLNNSEIKALAEAIEKNKSYKKYDL